MTNKTEQNNELREEELSKEGNNETLIKELKEKVEKLTAENEKYYEHLQRTAAEFDNYKKRVSKEKEKIYNLAVGDALTKFISVLDNLEKASNTESSDEKLKEGITLIHKQTADLFTSLNIEQIKTVGEIFNPDFHDAVMHIEDKNYGEQIIVEELRSGYKMGDRVLRHAMVKVAN